MWPRLLPVVSLLPIVLVACATGPTTDSATVTAREKTVSDQVLAFDSSAQAGGDPSCWSRKVATMEQARPFEAGTQGSSGSWSERWTVDRCGRMVPYLVNFTRAADGHLGVTILRDEGSAGATVPGGTRADPLLQRDTFLLLVQRDFSELEGGPCRSRRVKDTEVVSPVEGAQVEEGRPVAGQWAERWTLERCGAVVRYLIHYVTTRTGTSFAVELEK